ncbi:DUF1972 domain-containing protein [Arthrobacter cryoconiti]|uniref:DUF1972 domain-containing protein n=1 Tax=Arthrobacter cryoconiti TaxID=748907 RepID=A0ABV8R4D0_9MICC|nr:DUF1972 domain-containing protein [Arthrobacter cryoconiti]MCC9067007.1 DUF1972 domain-containing protein [Arthrobacter cryoconiti]
MNQITRKFEPLRIALIGTRGVPARYGGFETCVEEVGKRLVAMGHEVTVYCRRRKTDSPAPSTYLGMKLVHLPAPQKRSMETLVHTALSVGHLMAHRVDAAIVFNAANAPLLPVLRAARIPVATHVDGLEWKRAKWGNLGKKYYRLAEALAVRWSDALIADAVGIQDYYEDAFNAQTSLITYGAPILSEVGSRRLAEIGLAAGRYHLVVARFEPENHVDLIVEGYVNSHARFPLVVVGSAPYAAEYSRKIHDLCDDRVHLLGGLWDQQLLNELYSNAAIYWHGHSVGGTNPSLLRALGAGAAVNAFDVVFNKEVLGDAGAYFSVPQDVSALVEFAETNTDDSAKRSAASLERARLYDWDMVAGKYELLCQQMVADGRHGQRSSGRRYASAWG